MRHAFFLVILFIVVVFPAYAEMFKWVDEKGGVHFADDLSKIPEKDRLDVEFRQTPKEIPPPKKEEKPAPTPTLAPLSF